MPIVEQSEIDWAKEADQKENEVEYSEENGYKKVVSYVTENGKKFKITNIYKIEKVKILKSVAERKGWAKFGDSANDPPGINPSTTLIGDDISMQFLNPNQKSEDENDEKTLTTIPTITCNTCKGHHWTAKCPLKDIIQPQKPVEPSFSNLRSSKKFSSYKREEEFSVRVTNLSTETTREDLKDLFKQAGEISRVNLKENKNNILSTRVAYVSFKNEKDALKAVKLVDGKDYFEQIIYEEYLS